MDADWVFLGPGSWFTSVIPHLMVPGLREALVDHRGPAGGRAQPRAAGGGDPGLRPRGPPRGALRARSRARDPHRPRRPRQRRAPRRAASGSPRPRAPSWCWPTWPPTTPPTGTTTPGSRRPSRGSCRAPDGDPAAVRVIDAHGRIGTMAMTAQVKAELANTQITKTCCRKAEVASMLRFAGGLHIVSGRIVVEAELDTGAAARRLRKDIAEVYGHQSDVVDGAGQRDPQGQPLHRPRGQGRRGARPPDRPARPARPPGARPAARRRLRWRLRRRRRRGAAPSWPTAR